MKKYEAPKEEILIFETEDVITTSGGEIDPGPDGPNELPIV